jgi:hypothetical protein
MAGAFINRFSIGFDIGPIVGATKDQSRHSSMESTIFQESMEKKHG